MRKYSLSALVAAGLLAGGVVRSRPAHLQLTSGATAAQISRNASLNSKPRPPARATARFRSRCPVGSASRSCSGTTAVEENVYVDGLGTTLGSHVKFTGQATISPGWSAGYVLHLEAMGSR